MIVDKEELKRKLLLTPCVSKQGLSNWFKVYLGVELFDTIVSPDATSSPMDAAWELYDFGMYPKGDSPKEYLFACARNTQKTLLLSCVETVLALHARRESTHFAAQSEQVKPARKYMKAFSARPFIRDLLGEESSASIITYQVPEYDNADWLAGKTIKEIQAKDPTALRRVYIELVGLSIGTSQSKHSSICSADEISSVRHEEKKIALANIKKVPTVSHKGDPYLSFQISTRMGAQSPVEQAISDADKTGLLVRRWTAFEGIQKCTDERSGTDFVHERYVNIESHTMITESEYELLEEKLKDKFLPYNFASGCLTCPLAVPCRTAAKKQQGKSKFLQPINAAIVEYKSNETNFYNSQMLSLMPSKEGSVFSRFEENVHHVDAAKMYEIFSGQKPTFKMTQDKLVQIFRMKGLTCYAGLDWGFTDPTAVVHAFTDGERCFVVNAFAKTGLEPYKDVVPLLKGFQAKFGNFRIFPDTARPDNNQMLIGQGFDVHDQFTKKIDTGITRIKGFLSPPVGLPRIYFLKGYCDPLVEEMKKYHYVMGLDDKPTDDIADEFNHAIDSLRYLFLNVFIDGRSFTMSVGDDQGNIFTRQDLNDYGAQVYRGVPQEHQIESAPVTPAPSSGFSWDFGSEDE